MLLIIQEKVKLIINIILLYKINVSLFFLVITCCRMFRTFGNSNILHLITLPTIIPLETYFYNNYKKGAIILNLHQNNDYSPGKVKKNKQLIIINFKIIYAF